MSNSPRYGTNSTNTSKYMTDLLNEFIKMPKGVFNLSRRKIQDLTYYGIHPIECWEMLPNSDAYLQYNIQMISKNPTLKRLLSSANIELRVYKINYNDTWEGWNNFITKGRSGKISKSIPYVDLSLGSSDVTTSLPYNPMESLALAPSVFLASGGSGDINKFTFDYNVGVKAVVDCQSSGKTGISTLDGVKASTALRVSALPFVFYNKIIKEYQNSNLLQDNPHWYPENENHDMILPYNATGAVTTSDYDNPTKAFVNGTSVEKINAVNSGTDDSPVYESYPWLNVLQYSQRKGDYFNTGSPFPDLIRGDIPTIQAINGTINWDNVIINSNVPYSDSLRNGVALLMTDKVVTADKRYLGVSNTTNISQLGLNSSSDLSSVSGDTKTPIKISASSGLNSSLKEILDRATLENVNFSMAQWRYLATMTVLRERLALTDGSYNELIKAMFGHNPQWHNHNPIYCGGFRQPIVFSEVVNTTESSYAPLGDTAGRAVTNDSSHEIHVHSDDYGMFMTVLVITPDEYYSQGVEKMFSRLENAEQYMPILNNLSPDSTKNKELYVSGTNSTDEDVFNHQERFAYYKSRRNKVSGLMSLAISKIGDIGAYIQNRIFSSTPDFNAEFNRGDLTDNEKAIFASTNQAQFCAVIGSNMKYIAPIPEDSRPSDMGISY